MLVPRRHTIRLKYHDTLLVEYNQREGQALASLHRLLLQKKYGIFYVENLIDDLHQNAFSLQTVWQAHMEVTHDNSDTLANLRRLFREL